MENKKSSLVVADASKRNLLVAGAAGLATTAIGTKAQGFWGASRVKSCELISDTKAVSEVIRTLKKLENIHHGFPVNQLEHSLQAATLARKAGESDEVIVGTLCHDMAKTISAFNHEVMAAEMLKPSVSSNVYNMVKYHGIFQGRFFWDKIGRDHEIYKKFKGESWYNLTMKFTEAYDKPAFKTRDVAVDTLDSFIPVLRKVIKG